MAEVTLKFRVDGEQLTVIDQAGEKLRTVGATAQQSGGGLRSLFDGAMDLYGGFNLISDVLGQAGGVVDGLNKIGVESLRAKAGLDALTNGQSEQWATSLTGAMNGLVDDTDMMRAAMFALNAGVVTTLPQMTELTRIGGVLGTVFGGSAAGGIDALIRSLEMPGQTRGLKELGINIEAVKTKYDALKGTMSDQQAWMQAVFDAGGKAADKLGDTVLKGPGTALERLKVQWEDLKETFGEQVAVGLEAWFDKTLPAVGIILDKMTMIGGGATEASGRGAGMTSETLIGMMQAGGVAWATNQGISATTIIDAYIQATRGRDHGVAERPTISIGEIPGAIPQGQYGPVTLSQDDLQRNALILEAQLERSRRSRGGMGGIPLVETRETLADRMALAQTETRPATVADIFAPFYSAANEAGRQISGAAQNVVTGFRDAAIAAQRFSSVQEAFGLTGGGIGGELSGTVRATLDARREALVKGGAGAGQLAQFDQQSVAVMNQYLIATGQATKESIAFDEQQKLLAQSAEKGKLSIADYSRQMLAMAAAAASGKTSIEAMARAMLDQGMVTSFSVGGTYGKDLTVGALETEMDDLKRRTRAPMKATGKEGAKEGATEDDPYKALRTSVEQTTTAIAQGLGGAMANLANMAPARGQAVANGFETAVPSAQKLYKEVGNIQSLITGMQGTLMFAITWNPGGGGTNDGRAPASLGAARGM